MQNEQVKPNFEFVALMASLMSIVALTIDAILPAMADIGVSINSLDPTQNQLLVTMIFLGLGVGQLFFGPLSDSLGRKPIVYLGFTVFLIASVICLLAPNLEIMLIGRVLQAMICWSARVLRAPTMPCGATRRAGRPIGARMPAMVSRPSSR